MDRIWLAVLAICSLLGAQIASEEDGQHRTADEMGSTVAIKSRIVHTMTPDEIYLAGATEPMPLPEDSVSEEDLATVGQILKRFAVRHTALPERERISLAHAIVQEARIHSLDPDLVMAVIEVESAGYHLAESHVGAMGLMQLLPSTGKELAGKLSIEWKGPDTLFDPIINIRLGTAYLRELADRYDGNVSTALAAYNWGPGRIDRRIRRGANVPSKYIEQVMRAVDRYSEVGSTRS
jgi:soluble lytic murein transglycosylase-like protein